MAEFLSIAISAGLLVLSGLFSGLNLGLMALDTRALEMRIRSGTPMEKKWAEAILPLRKRGNFLLCTLLLGNTAVNACLAIFIGSFAGGFLGGVISTFAIVVFGEIIPQSICSRHGLAVGYYTRYLVFIFMIALCWLAWPIARMLDCILGEEISPVYSLSEIRQLILIHCKDGGKAAHGELTTFLGRLLTSALRMPSMCVRDAMIRAEDMPCVSHSQQVDAQLVFQLFNCIYPCIPVVEELHRSYTLQKTRVRRSGDIVNFVNVKDLILHSGLNAGITVKDILSMYDQPRRESNILTLDADEEMSQAYEKFKKHHRYFAIVVDDSSVVGFVSARDLQRGWTHEHAREDDDGARFGFRTDAVNKMVKAMAHRWRWRARASRKSRCSVEDLELGERMPGRPEPEPSSPQGVILDSELESPPDSDIDDEGAEGLFALVTDPRGNTALKDYLTRCRGRRVENSHQASVHRRTLFVIYAHLAKREAFSPSRIPPGLAVELLSLPRNFSIVPKGGEILLPGTMVGCCIVFRGQTQETAGSSVQGKAHDWKDLKADNFEAVCWQMQKHDGSPLQVFHEEALLRDDVQRAAALIATSSCYVLHITQTDYAACMVKASEASLKASESQLRVCDVTDTYETFKI
mmetsp:Transcript_22346/g.49466  ORF Transcript_22346/g.49466 Transcript_22346/m.49466 type:complete len:634 (+) Transcript_22346:92-1993(+)